MNDKVSVIVPVYNTEKYLQRCVDSLLNQTYKNIEVILVNDCSSDNSFSICSHYAESDKRVKVYSNQQNCGQAISRQQGIDNSTGNWIMFLDSDDEFAFDAVEKAVMFAEKQSVNMVFSSYTVIKNGKTSIEKANINSAKYNKNEFLKMCLSDISWDLMCCIGSKIYNKQFLNTFHIKFDPAYKYNEDGAFMLSVLRNADKVGYIDAPFYHYYIRTSGSTQSSYRQNMFRYINKTDIMLKDIFDTNGLFTDKTETIWYQKHMSLYLASLENEARFKSYSAFKQVFRQIKSDISYSDTVKHCTSSGAMIHCLVISLKHNLPMLIYFALKLSILRKGH